jgi:hypothetical protein
MFAAPIQEIELLHKRKLALGAARIEPGAPASVATSGRLFDVRAQFDVGQAKTFGLEIGPARVTYDAASARLMDMPLAPAGGKIRLQVLVDRPSIEICGNDGRVYRTQALPGAGEIDRIRVFADESPVQLDSLEVYELNSAWSR